MSPAGNMQAKLSNNSFSDIERDFGNFSCGRYNLIVAYMTLHKLSRFNLTEDT